MKVPLGKKLKIILLILVRLESVLTVLIKIICHQKYLCENIINKVKCSSCKYCNNAVKLCPNYKISIDCDLLKKNHHVCNAWDLYFKCKKVKIKYHAETAIKKHNAVQKVSRIGTSLMTFHKNLKSILLIELRLKLL